MALRHSAESSAGVATRQAQCGRAGRVEATGAAGAAQACGGRPAHQSARALERIRGQRDARAPNTDGRDGRATNPQSQDRKRLRNPQYASITVTSARERRQATAPQTIPEERIVGIVARLAATPTPAAFETHAPIGPAPCQRLACSLVSLGRVGGIRIARGSAAHGRLCSYPAVERWPRGRRGRRARR